MRRILLILAVITGAFLLTLPIAFAQSTATLSGTVHDASGAVISGASIVVTNSKSGVQRKASTGREGFFSVPQLDVGTYKLAVTAPGFTKYEVTDIDLNTADSKSVDVVLKVGAVTESVEVSAVGNTIAVEDSAEKSQLITNKELEDITLMGRNATEIVKIIGGATLSANGGKNGLSYDGQTIGINGSSIGGNTGGMSGVNINGQAADITQDGGHTFDPGASGAATPVNPNTNMISEVKVLTSNFSAENAQGPVVINTVTKQGGNAFHGEGYMYARNYVMNANDWFNNHQNEPRGESKYYYPGGNIGGPVPIHGLKDKLFFFEGFELYRQTLDGGLARAIVPNAAQQGGDFSLASQTPGIGKEGNLWQVPGNNGSNSTTPYDAAGDNPQGDVPSVYASWQNPTSWASQRPNCTLPTMQIPDPNPKAPTGTMLTVSTGVLSAGCIDANGQTILKAYLPQPNADPLLHNGYNFVQGIITPQNSWQNVFRIDYNITQNTKVFVRNSEQRETQNQPLGLWANSGSDNVVPSPTNIVGGNGTDSWAASLLHIFSPTMTSETTFAYTYINFPNAPADPTKILRSNMGLTLTGVYGNAQAPSFTTWGGSVPNLGSGANLGAIYHPTMICNKGIPSIAENLTKVFRTHSLKFGFYYEHVYNKQDNWGQYGVFQEAQGWGNTVGNNYADILMGLTTGSYTEQQVPPPTQISKNVMSFYAQDSWKATRRLTLEYGMRFDHYPKAYAANNYGLAIFDISKYSTDPLVERATHPAVTWHGLDHSVSLAGVNSTALFYSPRLGLAYDIFGNGRTIIRGGWGKYRAYESVQSNEFTGPAETALGAGYFSCSQGGGCNTFEDIDTQAVNHPLGGLLPAGLQSVTVVNPKNTEQPLVTTYDLIIDQRLPAKFNLELSYVGNHGDYLEYTNANVDTNAVPVGAIPYQTYLKEKNCQDPTGVTCTEWPSSGQDAYRPLLNYQSINQGLNTAKSQFDSFQASLRRSYSWVTMQANYTWSKAFAVNDVSGAYADSGLHEFWGVSPQNRAQALSLLYIFNLPKLNGGNAFLRGATNGWQISGVTQVESGPDMFVQNSYLNYTQDGLGTAPNIVAMHDQIGTMGTNGVNLYATIVCNPNMHKKVTLPDGTPGVQFFNPACFAPAIPGKNGTTNLPYLVGPMFWDTDLTLTKNFRITEHQGLQFRIAGFNFLNHPLTSFATSDANMKLHFDGNGNLLQPTFGTTTFPTWGIAQYKFGHRIVELGVKYTF